MPPDGQRHGLSAAAQEALAKPVGLLGCAAVAASHRGGCRRVGDRLGRGGCDVGCACCQWSSAHPRWGTLVRHFMCGAGVGVRVGVARDVGAVALSGPQCGALAPAVGACRVPDAPTARALVTTGCLAPGEVVRLTPAGAAAIPVAAIAAAAQDDLNAAPGAQEQAGWAVQRHHQTKAGSAGRSRPSGPHCCGTAFIGTVSGAAQSSSCHAREGCCRAHLLRLGSVVPRLALVAPGGARANDWKSRRADLRSSRPLLQDHSDRLRPRLSGRPAGRPDRRIPSSISRSARNAPQCSRMETQIRVLAIT